MGNLLCLATFARVASSQKLSRGDESAQQVPGWLQSINHFFGAKRGLKTLDLVVLRVILACSTSCQSLMADQAAESIRLGIDICATVEGSQRETWIQTNSSKIAKLCEKVTRDNTEPEVQMLVCIETQNGIIKDRSRVATLVGYNILNFSPPNGRLTIWIA